MGKEEKVQSTEEDKKVESQEETKEEKKSEEEEPKKEEAKEEYETEGDSVPTSKYNQLLRKQREAEQTKRELEKKLAEASNGIEEDEEEEEDDDSLFGEEDERKVEKDSTEKIVDEKLKPVMESLKKKEESDKKIARTEFFDAHPEYLKNSEKWQELLDEMDNSLNPNSKDDYYTQLEKTHRIVAGDSYDEKIEDKKKDIASDASGAEGAEKAAAKEEFTAEDRKQMKDFDISEDGMRAFKEKTESGSMQIL